MGKTSKVALVTGSTSGIGKAIAERLAKSGHNVVLNGFGDADQINTLVQSMMDQYKVDVVYSNADMSNPQDIEKMIHMIQNDLGGLDIVVNNAGVQHVCPIENFPLDKWELIIAVNLAATFHVIRHAFAMMKEKKWGRIVNIASAHALVASPFKSAYVAAKHGIAGLTKTVALEGAEFGITCNAICPGYVRTSLVENQIEATAKARGISKEAVMRDVLLAAQPTKKFVTVEEVAELANHLCSPFADSINGAILPIDGGWVAH